MRWFPSRWRTALRFARPAWAARPTLVPAIAAGFASSAAPLLLVQPAFRMGVPDQPAAEVEGAAGR